MMALALVMGLAMNVQAAYQVQMTLTAPSIAKSGCEKAGAVTFSFADQTTLAAGDWWYFDLDQGATLCKAIDYFVVGGTAAQASTADAVTITNENAQLMTLAGTVLSLNVTANNLGGPLKLTGATVAGAGSIVFRIKGDSGSRRIYVYVYGTAATDNIVFTVGAGQSATLSLLNGYSYDGTAAGNNGVAPANAATYLVRVNTGSTTVYGTKLPETGEASVPYVQNSLCVNASAFGGNDIYISLNSRNDFLTFTGDSKIAHVADNPLKLALCKADKADSIKISTQGSCSYDMESSLNDCDTAINRVTVTTDSPFSGQEAFDVVIQSMTSGVYFGGVAQTFPMTSKEDVCNDTPAAAAIATTKNSNEAGTNDVPFANNSCTINATNRVNKVWTTGGAINSLATYNSLWINLPTLMYDTSMIQAGTEVKVMVAVNKRPCGGSLTETFTLGTFVTTCPTDTTGTKLMYPFLPPMGGLGSWWGGFTATNMTAVDGTIKLTFMEYDGDKATLEVTVKAGQTYVATSDAALLAQVTEDPGNAGPFGDANIAIMAECSFENAAGMTFTGNGTEGVGYTAYANGGMWD